MESPGVDKLYFWMGQVVSEQVWQQNNRAKPHKSNTTKGENYRYKVRIFGRHEAEKTIPDKDLFTASVLLPTTAGSGHNGSSQTPNIKAGTYVVGYYLDGDNGNQPVISHVLPNNAKTQLFQGNPDRGFTPFSEFSRTRKISTQDIEITNKITESIDPNISKVGDRDKYIDGTRTFYVPKTKDCEGPSGSLKGVQKGLGDAIKFLNLVKSGVLGTSSDLQGLISNQLNFIQSQITVCVKTLIDSIRTFLLNKINEQLNLLYLNLEPQLKVTYSKEFEKVTDLFLCIFQKIIRNLFSLVKSIFANTIDKYLNAPLCAAESFIGSIINNIFNTISQGINSLIAPLGIAKLTGNIFSGLSIVVGILEFLTCEDELNCEMTEEWSLFNGVKTSLEEVQDDISKRVSDVTSTMMQGLTPISCSTSQIPCGPPQVRFISSSGSGASGNPIISITGSIIGVDLLTGGTYKTAPTIEFIDNCGNGSGAVAVAIMKKKIKKSDDVDNDDEFEVENVAILDSGTGYLQYPDGSTGSQGETFSTPDDTILFNNDTGFTVIPSNTTVDVLEGDVIYSRIFSQIQVFDEEGNVVQEITGRGQTTPITIISDGTLTTPEASQTERSNGQNPASDSAYPVVLELQDIIVTDKGSNYSDNDKVTLNPDNGALIDVVFENGVIKDIIVKEKGIGFNDVPEINIASKTGFNATLLPLFNVVRIGDLTENNDNISAEVSIINVVDCVGKV